MSGLFVLDHIVVGLLHDLLMVETAVHLSMLSLVGMAGRRVGGCESYVFRSKSDKSKKEEHGCLTNHVRGLQYNSAPGIGMGLYYQFPRDIANQNALATFRAIY